MSFDLEFLFENVPYWSIQLVILFFFTVLSWFIFKIRSKIAVVFFITVLALITFYILDFFSMNYCADVKSSVISEKDIHLVGSYCIQEEHDIFATLLEFFKAFVLWSVTLVIFFFKPKSPRKKNAASN